jgi:hypothetical protein
MIKKRQMTNRLYGANGGWSSIRQVKYDGIGHLYDIEYHQVSPIVSGGEWQEMMKWITDTFGTCSYEKGPGVWTPNQRWYANNSKFLFKDQQDCEWFMLRWE